MSFVLVQLLSGLANACSLFLVASGLSIIFGVSRIVNFAHGSLYMLGAYLAYTIMSRLSGMPTLWGPLGFWDAVLVTALVVGMIGVVMEITILRRLYRSAELFQLVATFGVLLMIEDATLALWGPEDRLGPRAPGLSGAILIGDERLPSYDLALIVLGPLVLGLLWLVFNRTRWGTLVRAATQDREMVAALGVDQANLFTTVFFLGACLAGLGGAVQVPREAVNLQMDLNVIVEAFVVVVVGGMGSILGAFLAAVLIAELGSLGVLLLPQSTLALTFVVMAVALMLRPTGLLGRAEAPAVPVRRIASPLVLLTIWQRGLGWVMTAVLLALPLIAGEFTLTLMIEILIFALFAQSLHLIMGPGGMASFGHAAYFGLGAYGAALLVHGLGGTMIVGLVAAPLAAGLGALLLGWVAVRLSGVYLAMLSLAFAQILWSVASQWYGLTGGDDGLLGIWPASWASSKLSFYYLTLALSAGGILTLRRIVHAPFGYALRAGRDSPLRAAAIGIDLRRQQWLAFALAGLFAGLSGGLYAFSKGSVFPTTLAVQRSVDALVMVLLGGVETLTGPLVGAGVYTWLADAVSRLEYWRAILGGVIVLLVVAFPAGLVGFARDRLASVLGFHKEKAS